VIKFALFVQPQNALLNVVRLLNIISFSLS
jgi:hypothetical protein